jgi:hypothetical protein
VWSWTRLLNHTVPQFPYQWNGDTTCLKILLWGLNRLTSKALRTLSHSTCCISFPNVFTIIFLSKASQYSFLRERKYDKINFVHYTTKTYLKLLSMRSQSLYVSSTSTSIPWSPRQGQSQWDKGRSTSFLLAFMVAEAHSGPGDFLRALINEANGWMSLQTLPMVSQVPCKPVLHPMILTHLLWLDCTHTKGANGGQEHIHFYSFPDR